MAYRRLSLDSAVALTAASADSTAARRELPCTPFVRAIWSTSSCGIDRERLRLGVVVDRELVDADDHALVVVDRLGVLVGRLFDLVHLEARSIAATAPPISSMRLDVLPRQPLDLVGQRLDEVRAGERVERVGHAGLVADDLLGAQRDPCRLSVGRLSASS